MAAEIEAWDGHEWEAHLLRLLHDQYGAENVQKVPAKHKGDCGLDYFCLEKRVVYQCYAVEEPVDVATRSAKQKSKITTDIGKFCDPAKGAAQIFAGYKIKRWILAVPLHDSREVVEHAMKKTADVIAKNLAYVDPEFQILVHDREDFDEASWKRRAQLRNRIRPIVPVPTREEVVAAASGDQNLTENLRRKLQVRFDELGALEDAVDDALRISLESQVAVEALRKIAPEAYEDVTRLTSLRLRRLSLGSRGAGNIDRLDAEIDGLKSSILTAVPNLDPGTAETIAFGAVSEWLMRCPLRLD
ncbi:hypothetical protein [Magnetospirillum sulfuroxidans]|uniref:Uncharacterized protein n=1 Tax=Magnetospirillum sulfuroxidans TaxID=611300 RepID=A0ABS5IJK4_9PROT|nr:hypothetical protein [Magnetospirillum sulfuroxidans]MBR9973878.1 hypothetical protein [Magnetospirillum sulfuroxidans]